jgi:hypothetical protein
MENDLKAKLAEILTGIADNAAQLKDFAVEQLPDVAQQYIAYGRVLETAVFLIVCALNIVTIKICIWGAKQIRTKGKNRDFCEPLEFMSLLLGGFASLFLITILLCQIKPFFMVWFAPKIYLIQGISSLIK